MHLIIDTARFLFNPVWLGTGVVIWLLLVMGIAGRVVEHFEELRHLRAAKARPAPPVRQLASTAWDA